MIQKEKEVVVVVVRVVVVMQQRENGKQKLESLWMPSHQVVREVQVYVWESVN